jgi:hypothetical protein
VPVVEADTGSQNIRAYYQTAADTYKNGLNSWDRITATAGR